ncbi:MAG: cytochrome C oxidase subunit IV family protein [Phycisphaerales bacterium]|nr:cytochrome C oxidase subunit IV family protein [Phycisphaerales bacterium]MCI0632032.1 cytochrome C oxidase subunit IV family protein [Phycisphaerales bacterium]
MAHQPTHPKHHDPHHASVGHLVSPKILIATAAALLVLTFVTVQVASIDFSAVDLRELNIFVALGIAVIKASLVCLYFMHLRWDRPFNAFLLIASLALVALFISFALTDRSEYLSEIVPGESTEIQRKLNESPQPGGPLSGVNGVPEH